MTQYTKENFGFFFKRADLIVVRIDRLRGFVCDVEQRRTSFDDLASISLVRQAKGSGRPTRTSKGFVGRSS